MAQKGVPLRELILAAQRDVQQVLEHLASPAARRIGPDAPAAVIATVGAVRLAVPVTFHLRPAGGRAGATAAQATGPDPAAAPAAGDPAPAVRWELRVATPATCPPGTPLGRVEIDFITCPKEYGS